MEYTRLGKSGLKVSRIALGCMSFGDTARGFNEWSLGEDEAGPFFAQAVELGITLWDTANVYQLGSSEEIVGLAATSEPPQCGPGNSPKCSTSPNCTAGPSSSRCKTSTT